MNKLIWIIGIIILILLGFGIFKLTGNTVSNENFDKVTLKVSIPCSGHVLYITSNLEKVKGIARVNYLGNFNFEVQYDSSQINEEQILNLNVFKEYPAKKIS